MKYFIAIFCAVVLAASVCESERVHFKGYKVYRVEFKTDEQFQILFQMDMNSPDVSFWQLSHQEHYADIMVAPAKIPHFLAELDSQGFKYEILIEDVEKQINENRQ